MQKLCTFSWKDISRIHPSFPILQRQHHHIIKEEKRKKSESYISAILSFKNSFVEIRPESV